MTSWRCSRRRLTRSCLLPLYSLSVLTWRRLRGFGRCYRSGFAHYNDHGKGKLRRRLRTASEHDSAALELCLHEVLTRAEWVLPAQARGQCRCRYPRLRPAFPKALSSPANTQSLGEKALRRTICRLGQVRMENGCWRELPEASLAEALGLDQPSSRKMQRSCSYQETSNPQT